MIQAPRCPSCGRPLPDAAAACEHCATLLGGPQPKSSGPTADGIEGYRILRRLGAGGMGVVYLAEDETLHRRVALKVMSARFAEDAAARARFLREARAMATVEHPHVVRIYSYGGSRESAYIVMELVEGESLAERIRARGRLPLEEVERLAGQIVAALEAAWHKGIVHRDVKPANVLIDARGDVRVADFGLAKPVASSDELPLTQDGRIVGTPHYLSPEQARGEKADFRSDIYSLGVVLYEMLAGAPPFVGSTPVAVVAQHLHTEAPPLQEKRLLTDKSYFYDARRPVGPSLVASARPYTR